MPLGNANRLFLATVSNILHRFLLLFEDRIGSNDEGCIFSHYQIKFDCPVRSDP